MKSWKSNPRMVSVLGSWSPVKGTVVFIQDSLRLQSGEETSQLNCIQVYIWIVFNAIQRIQAGRRIRELRLQAGGLEWGRLLWLGKDWHLPCTVYSFYSQGKNKHAPPPSLVHPGGGQQVRNKRKQASLRVYRARDYKLFWVTSLLTLLNGRAEELDVSLRWPGKELRTEFQR